MSWTICSASGCREQARWQYPDPGRDGRKWCNVHAGQFKSNGGRLIPYVCAVTWTFPSWWGDREIVQWGMERELGIFPGRSTGLYRGWNEKRGQFWFHLTYDQILT